MNDNNIEKQNPLDVLLKSMSELPQVDIPVTHTFSKGIYCRSMFVPAGSILRGEIHKFDHLNIISMGSARIVFDNGEVRDVSSPWIGNVGPGCCAAHFITDSVWSTIHATEETDISKIKEEFIAPNRESYLEFRKNLELQGE